MDEKEIPVPKPSSAPATVSRFHILEKGLKEDPVPALLVQLAWRLQAALDERQKSRRLCRHGLLINQQIRRF
jgi:hypothetical protein